MTDADKNQRVTVTLPADVLAELNRAYEAHTAAGDALSDAMLSGRPWKIQGRRDWAASMRDLAEVYERAIGPLARVSPALGRAALLAGEHFDALATTVERDADEAEARS